LFTGVPTEKREKVLDVINQVHILYPTMKFVLSPEGNIMTSMIFHGNENNVDGKMILMCTLEFFKAFDANVYKRFAEILEN
jgi:hypothetical protein